MSSGAPLDGRDAMGPYEERRQAVTLRNLHPTIYFPSPAVIFSKNPLPDGHKGPVSDQMIQFLSGAEPGVHLTFGNEDKAIKAAYEVIVSEVNGVQNVLVNCLEAFKDVTSNVGVDK
ncbi:hypothetical protein F4776DRAFT_660491 [Hypoxylon sp. NC0597]|nr:hypothetical protein F4776DRAFT_660491 [Hypoxylon sp. NC0597]